MTYNMLYTYGKQDSGISLALHYVHQDEQQIYFHFELENKTRSDFEFYVEVGPDHENTALLDFQPSLSWIELLSTFERKPYGIPKSLGWFTTGFCVSLPKAQSSGIITLWPKLKSPQDDGDRAVIYFPPIDIFLDDSLCLATASNHFENEKGVFSLQLCQDFTSTIYDKNGITINVPWCDFDEDAEFFYFPVTNNTQRRIALVWELLAAAKGVVDVQPVIEYFNGGADGHLAIRSMSCEPMALTEFCYSIIVVDTESKDILAKIEATTVVDLYRIAITTQI